MAKEDRRQKVLEAAMAAIAERGLSRVRMDDIGALAGMSKGHVLYYYRSKERLLLETLWWSEERLAEERTRRLAELPSAADRLRVFVEIYLPHSAGEPAWMLWLQVWALGMEHDEVRIANRRLTEAWVSDLCDIIRLGQEQHIFAELDPEQAARAILAVLDGLSLHVLEGLADWDVERASSVAMTLATECLLQRTVG